jgi:signal transduction histidine kinase
MQGMIVPETSIAGWVSKNRAPVIVNDVHSDPRYFRDVEEKLNSPIQSLAAIPLIATDGLIGALEVVNKMNGYYINEDIDLLVALGSQAATAIHISRLFRQTNLISDFVHELRTPLSSINTIAFLLQKPELADKQRLQLGHTIQVETQRLSDLATSFLDLASLESGRAQFRMVFFDLINLSEEVIHLVEPKATENNIQIICEFPSKPISIEADKEKIKQVLINLINNAIKYNRVNGKIWIRLQATHQGVEFQIEDTGLGIPEDEFSHVFEKFFRARNVQHAISGTGLGLSICKRIIDNHAGTIEVKSTQDKGTLIIFWLPSKQAK